jgi:hypothetical protein
MGFREKTDKCFDKYILVYELYIKGFICNKNTRRTKLQIVSDYRN